MNPRPDRRQETLTTDIVGFVLQPAKCRIRQDPRSCCPVMVSLVPGKIQAQVALYHTGDPPMRRNGTDARRNFFGEATMI